MNERLVTFTFSDPVKNLSTERILIRKVGGYWVVLVPTGNVGMYYKWAVTTDWKYAVINIVSEVHKEWARFQEVWNR